ncbi:MAG: hypothetical protein U0V72_04355 [Cytophagales bacterium]
MNIKSVIYLDIELVPVQIKDTINVSKYGDIIFKKTKIKDHHHKIFVDENRIEYTYVDSVENLEKLIKSIEFSSIDGFLLQMSSFVVVNKDLFKIFLEKINYAPISFVVSEYDVPKGFLKLNKIQTVEFLKTYLINGLQTAMQTVQDSKKFERLNLEQFYVDVQSYTDLIKLFQTNFELRYFNSIEKKDNLITKKSVDKKKMLAEYSYYGLLADELKLYFLPTFGYTETENYSTYSLEKLQVPDVSLQWIHFSFTDEEFEQLMNRLFKFLRSRPLKQIAIEELKNINKLYFYDKVKERFEQLKKDAKYASIKNFIHSISSFVEIDELYKIYFDLYEKNEAKILKLSTLAMSHGDLCFSNMLYDKRIDLLKLIDPKGGTKVDDIFLPSLYDVAKLSHSVMGKYDFINNALYDFSFDENLKATLHTHKSRELTSKEDIFIKKLNEHNLDLDTVRLLECSLFLSMLPLHLDNPKKVTAFILNANQILNTLK